MVRWSLLALEIDRSQRVACSCDLVLAALDRASSKIVACLGSLAPPPDQLDAAPGAIGQQVDSASDQHADQQPGQQPLLSLQEALALDPGLARQ
mmetsp:Transcript_21274/g.47769  ORF Transcript_21274/g.47769 Transcript_21274/m.47769 type:complete len:94 (-) Transcript_21274:206-487(-)